MKEHLSSMARELAKLKREGKEREGGGDGDSLGVESTPEEGEEDSLREIKPSEKVTTSLDWYCCIELSQAQPSMKIVFEQNSIKTQNI